MPEISPVFRIPGLRTFNLKKVWVILRSSKCASKMGLPKICVCDVFNKYERWPLQKKAPPGHAKRVAWCLMATTSDGTNSLLAHIFWWGLSCGKIHILQHRCSSTFFGTIWSFTKVIVIMWYTIFKNTASSCFRCKLIYASQHRCSNTLAMVCSSKNGGIK